MAAVAAAFVTVTATHTHFLHRRWAAADASTTPAASAAVCAASAASEPPARGAPTLGTRPLRAHAEPPRCGRPASPYSR